jgi:hypothetical protein
MDKETIDYNNLPDKSIWDFINEAQWGYTDVYGASKPQINAPVSIYRWLNFFKRNWTTISPRYIWDSIALKSDSAWLYLGTWDDMKIYYDWTNWYIDTSLITASDLHIKCWLQKTLILDNVVYDDIVIGFSWARVPASNAPTWATFTTNTSAYKFWINDYLDINASEMLHWWKEWTDIEIHIHWANNWVDLTDRAVKWQMYFTRWDVNEAFSAEQTATVETTIPASTTDKTHFLSSFWTFR